VQGVEWTVLGSGLIGHFKYNHIKQLQDTSNENRLRAVVEYWLGGGRYVGEEPSWRRLIWTLDEEGQTQVADKIRHFAEPVLGKSCVSISVSTFLYSVSLLPWHDTHSKRAPYQHMPTTHTPCILIIVRIYSSSRHHWEKHFVPYCEVSLTQRLLGIFLVGVVLCNWAVELNVATFPQLSLAVHWQERLSRG